MDFSLPASLRTFFSSFPLHVHPAIRPPRRHVLKSPTLWILPPHGESNILSNDVECLKWQAYLALRGLTEIAVRWDISPDGAIDGQLPNLQIPVPGKSDAAYSGELLAAHLIPTWVDGTVEGGLDPLEGYKDDIAKDESRAWVSLLEGNVHAALILFEPKSEHFLSFLFPDQNSTRPIQTLLSPPPAPLSGFSSLLPSYGTRVCSSAVEAQYREAIRALSERLGTDTWFLGSAEPTALDALVFAYLYCLLHAKDTLRFEVTRRVNLVAWECRVRNQVSAAFYRLT